MVFSSSDSDSNDSFIDMGNNQCKNCKICNQTKNTTMEGNPSSEKDIVKMSEKTKRRIKNIDLLQDILVNKMEELIYDEQFIEADIFKQNIQLLEKNKIAVHKVLQNVDESIEKLDFKKANDFTESYKELMANCVNFNEIKEFLDKEEKRKIRELISD
uniref:Biogenesis of lysosome-related organelles complex 1 subunit 5 n=1 Tax=Strongyloides papillosus TaxID=174720 RepID=A0A0N5BVR3_STREA